MLWHVKEWNIDEYIRYLDAVIDSSGGDIIGHVARLLKHGGIISIYGMTMPPHKVTFDMAAVLKNIDVSSTENFMYCLRIILFNYQPIYLAEKTYKPSFKSLNLLINTKL